MWVKETYHFKWQIIRWLVRILDPNPVRPLTEMGHIVLISGIQCPTIIRTTRTVLLISKCVHLIVRRRNCIPVILRLEKSRKAWKSAVPTVLLKPGQ